MARAHFVKSARKAIKGSGIKKGDSYYWWKFRYGGKRVSKTPPSRSQLTQSAFLGAVYDIEDRIAELNCETMDDLFDELQSIADDIRSLGEEQQERLDAMPEALQDSSSSGELLRERVDACEGWADELESIVTDEPDRQEIEARVRSKEPNKSDEHIAAIVDEEYETELSDAIRAAIEEAQGASVPSA